MMLLLQVQDASLPCALQVFVRKTIKQERERACESVDGVELGVHASVERHLARRQRPRPPATAPWVVRGLVLVTFVFRKVTFLIGRALNFRF